MRSSSEWKVMTASRPPGFSPSTAASQHRRQRAQLVVHGDADGLKAALGGVLLFPQRRARAWPRVMMSTSSSVVSMGCSCPRRARWPRQWRAHSAPRRIRSRMRRSSSWRPGVHHVQAPSGRAAGPCACPAARPAYRKSPAARVVQLGRGNAQVKEHPVHAADAQLVQHSVKSREVAVDQRHPVQPWAPAARFAASMAAWSRSMRDEPARLSAGGRSPSECPARPSVPST